VVISPGHLEEMLGHLRAAFPAEGCGLLGGLDGEVLGVFPITNADNSPVHYTLDAREQLAAMEALDERGWDLLAIYHSHTRTRPFPSATDVEMAQVAQTFYPDALYVIASLARWEQPEVRAFRIEGHEVREEPIQVAEARLSR
jgi:proteasome lid subunit RPN8/RPN11